MINWIKELFHTDELPKDHNRLPLVICEIPMPEVKPTKPETGVPPDISEPVLAIVECMKKYPSRFKLTDVEYNYFCDHWWQKFTVSDVKTGQMIIVRDQHSMYKDELSSSWNWLTQDELALLKVAFQEMLEIKTKRMHSIQRAKMKGIYK
ncbi:MAG: hypothetical protein EOO06_00810 [Chitinophagaceae bacterium]|nr:MAG: hypothetical protein EOO06_00810 [Chitinophagaceae bacterium]